MQGFIHHEIECNPKSHFLIGSFAILPNRYHHGLNTPDISTIISPYSMNSYTPLFSVIMSPHGIRE